MFQLAVKGDSMVYHFSVRFCMLSISAAAFSFPWFKKWYCPWNCKIPTPNSKASSVGFDDDDDDANADADFNDGFDDPAESPPAVGVNSRYQCHQPLA